jgi:hypothetical protein
MTAEPAGSAGWGRVFDPDRLARLELRMWKAYYRRQPLRLFALLVEANRVQAGVSWATAVRAAALLARAAAGFGRATGNYDRFLPDIERGYRALGLPADVDAAAVAGAELRWWVVRREIGLAAGEAAGAVIAELYAAIYGLPIESVAEAGRLRGLAAEVRDRGAADDPEGPTGAGRAYWPEVGRLLRASYRSLRAALDARAPDGERVDQAVGAAAGADRPTGASNEYHMVTRWRIPATPGEVAEVLFADTEDLARWWPAVYMGVRLVEPGDERGIGALVALYTKGWLPYTLRWQFRVTESDLPGHLRIAAVGDFVGRGIWTIKEARAADDPAGPLTTVEYDWLITAEKGVLRTFSAVMKPIFAANHDWAMRQGERSLRLELARRRTTDPVVLAAIPAPPGPTFPHSIEAFRGRV